MKILRFSVAVVAFSMLVACGSEAPVSNNPSNGQDTTTPDTTTSAAPNGNGPQKPDCKMAGKILDGNQFWDRSQNLLVAIAADKETEDPEAGESHRIVMVYDGNTCQQVFREILPVNLSPDYPYYLSEITYNKLNKVIAIRGFEKVYVFDLVNRKLSAPLVPKFLNQRYVEDASSGSINRLEVWENYLVGNAASLGPFVFDLRNPAKPEPVLPFAEYEVVKGEQYNTLFLLKSLNATDGYQALLPRYDADKEEFSINPLFEKPRNIETNFNKKFKNNKHLVLKEFLSGTESRPVAIDMSAMKMVNLPPEIATKKDTEIIEWMKKQ
jgi:hypothetical protein